MEYRTDLAVESKVFRQDDQELPKGIQLRREQKFGIDATIVTLKTTGAAHAVGKPKGTYITMELQSVLRREKESFTGAVVAMGAYLRDLLKIPDHLPVLVAGLGNRDVTPDAIGPLTVDHIFVTRHMLREMPRQFGQFRAVSAISPGVLGTTGMESAEIIRAMREKSNAAAVIAVDAFAAIDTCKLCSTIQISNSGIVPGSGIGNRRCAIDERTLGVPVIAVGVPTVTHASTLAADLLEQSGFQPDHGLIKSVSSDMIVTSSDIDRRIREISRVLAYGINYALHSDLTLDDLSDLTY